MIFFNSEVKYDPRCSWQVL